MNEILQSISTAVTSRFGVTAEVFKDELTLRVPANQIVDVVRALRDEHQFQMLVAVTGVDYWPQLEPRFNVVYILNSFTHNVLLHVRVPLDGNTPSLPSVTSLYPSANWYEREVWDMFGIRFEGHPDPRRIIMPADWEGHPLRKDYPLGYEEIQFTFNVEDVNATKRFAAE